MTKGALVWWAAGILVCLGVVLRAASLGVATPDFIYFVLPWTQTLASHPALTAFGSPFSDYAPLYLYILKALTLIPLPTLYSVKLLSVLGDAAIALLAALIVRQVEPAAPLSRSALAFGVMWCVPTVVLNGALWGQSDALYAAFALASVFFMMRGRPGLAALMLGVSISFKLQAVFLAPLFVGWMLRQSKSLTYLFAVPGIFVLSLVPAIVGGGSVLYWGLIYIKESGEYTSLSLGAPSFFAFFLDAQGAFENGLEALALVMCAVCAAWILWLVWSETELSPRRLLLLCLACAIAMPFFLPRMHERYFYLADILSVAWALAVPRQWYVAALVVGASLIGYMAYLKQAVPFMGAFALDLRIGAIAMLVALVVVCVEALAERAV